MPYIIRIYQGRAAEAIAWTFWQDHLHGQNSTLVPQLLPGLVLHFYLGRFLCLSIPQTNCPVYICREARPLVKVTVKCPCGRKSSHQVVQEGQRAAALRCDAACVQAGRQQQLAGAFGVEDPAHHVSSFDRNRSASISSDPAVSTRW